MCGIWRCGLAGLVISLAAPTNNAVALSCASLRPGVAAAATQRAVIADDLLRLRDIGAVNAYADDQILSVSPDGTQVAFQLRMADPDTNTYCLGMFVASVDGTAAPVEVNAGGDLVLATISSQGFAVYPLSGVPSTITAKWSPDGQWIAFLRRDQAVTQLWRARADGTSSAPVTAGKDDIESFAWSDDGTKLAVATRPGLDAGRQAIRQEGLSGYLFDDRYIPYLSSQPQLRGDVPQSWQSINVDTGAASPAAAPPIDIGDNQAALPAAADLVTKDGLGNVAWSEADIAGSVSARSSLRVRLRDDRSERCDPSLCDGAIGLWWLEPGKRLAFIRREGWADSELGVYVWDIGSKPRRTLVTEDLLIGCQAARHHLICGREGSLQPRRIVSIDPATGQATTVFDPNAEFANLRLGTVERLHWTNAYGVESFGDLVRPADGQGKSKRPLIVVQYSTKGFLRGGVGDAFPIQLFAAAGYDVLSLQAPKSIGLSEGAKTWTEVGKLDRVDWRNRRNILSSVETILDALEKKGEVDPARIGITGVSDGASTVQFALLNSHRFAAAAIGSCCDEEYAAAVLNGPAVGRWMAEMGYPKLTEDGSDFWRDMSFRDGSRRMNTPLLIQIPDREYLAALEDVTALREAHKPVEMFLFPDEYHVLWQPAHRRAAYIRSLEWFDYWLGQKPDTSGVPAGDAARWTMLRTEWLGSAGVAKAH